MRIRLFWRVMPFYICIGLFFALPLAQQRTAASQARDEAGLAEEHLRSTKDHVELISGTPVRIVLPRFGIDLKIVTGNYVVSKGTWTVSDNYANYAIETTSLNNNAGKTLIYGHANSKIFSKTIDLVPGDVVYVYSGNNHVFKYEYKSKTVVEPTNVEILNELNGRPGLVIMSCDGVFYQNRRLMYFDLVSAT